MNNSRRAEIDEIVGILSDAKTSIEYIRDDEQGCLDSIPENLEGSDRYSKMEMAVEHLEDAIDSLGDALESLEKASE